MNKKLLIVLLILINIVPFQSFGDVTTYEMYSGQTLALVAKIFEDNGEEIDSDVDWESSDSSIASVSDGIVTAKSKGSVAISYSSESGASIHSGTVFITVKPTVRSIEIIVPKEVIKVGESMITDYNIKPVTGLDDDIAVVDDVSYTSTDKNVFTVDKDGIIKGISEGTAYLKVKTDDSERTDSQKITVESSVTGVSINTNVKSIYVGEELTMNVTVLPDTAFNKDVTWDSTHHISVSSDGIIVGLVEGTGYITVSTKDGDKKDSIALQVVSMVRDLVFDDDTITIDNEQNEYQLTVNLIPANSNLPPINSDIDWDSSNTSVATVSSSGLVKVKRTGTTVITATSEDGGHTDSIIIRAILNEEFQIQPSHISINNHPTTAQSGETILISYELLPLDATEDKLKVQLFGGDGNVSDKDGYIEFTGYDEGRYTLIITTENDLKATTTVNVKSNLSGVSILPEPLEENADTHRYTIYLGQEGRINHELSKKKLTSQILIDEVDWTSSDSSIISIDDKGNYSAKKEGLATLRVETKDSGYFADLRVEVLGMADSIELPSHADIGLNMSYEPSPIFGLKPDVLYNITSVLEKDFDLEVVSASFPREFLEGEVEYEKNRQANLEDLVDAGFYAEGDVSSEISKSENRVASIETLLRKGDEEFVEVFDIDTQLTDRDFKTWKLGLITNNNSISSYYVAKIVIRITTIDGGLEDEMTVYAHGDVTELRLYDDYGKLLKESDNLDSETIKQQINATQDADTNAQIAELREEYSLIDLRKQPSDETIISVDEARAYNLVQSAFESNFKRGITRLEMAKLCIQLYDLYHDVDPGSFQYSVFTDTNDTSAIRAFQYGIVSASVDRLFKPDEVISREEMTHMLFRTLIAMDKELSSEKAPERSSYFLDEDSIQQAYKQAVGYMCYDHAVIYGITDDHFWPQIMAQIDYVLMYTMNTIKAIEE